MGGHWLALITVPIFTGAIGYLTNWSGVWMLFEPVHFVGVKVPGVASFVRVMPRKVQQIPGLMQGGVGWQGIIPSRAAKMGSIAVDKGIAKLGSPAEFYGELEPERIAEHIVVSLRGDLRGMVDDIIAREHPDMWRDLPPAVRQRVHDRVQEQMPDIVHTITDEIGRNIDELVDIKLMVIRNMEENPGLANRIFRAIGRRELKLIVNFGFYFGFVLGIPVALLTEFVLTQWWVLPICGVLVGYITNYLAIWMIFEPIEARRILGIKWQGLFLRRQREVSEVYAKIVADEIVTLRHLGDELINGPRGDRTRAMIESAMRPAIDRASGSAQSVVRLAVGGREYRAIQDSVAARTVDPAMTPLADEGFNRLQAERVRVLLRDRMREMSPKDFSEMLRTVVKQDEWLLYLHGAVLGFAGGLAHLAVFG
jgi:uncharacterized membrane protein YheB (UPF0754 family)